MCLNTRENMYYCKEIKIKYSKDISRLLLPELINNSKTIVPWKIVQFSDMYVCFTPQSNIIWGKEELTLTNYFYSAHMTMIHNTSRDSYLVIYNGGMIAKEYPHMKKTHICVGKNELKNTKSSYDLKVEKASKVRLHCYDKVITNNKLKDVEIGEIFQMLGYEKDENNERKLEACIVTEARRFSVEQKNGKVVSAIAYELYNITKNTHTSSQLSFLDEMKENNFKVIDNYTPQKEEDQK